MSSIKTQVLLSGPGSVPVQDSGSPVAGELKINFNVIGITGTPTLFKLQKFLSNAAGSIFTSEETAEPVGPNLFQFNFTQLDAETTYYFKSRIDNADGDSKLSAFSQGITTIA